MYSGKVTYHTYYPSSIIRIVMCNIYYMYTTGDFSPNLIWLGKII